jgi:hypothetical protein
MPALDEVDQAYYTFSLVEGARVSKNKIWLPRMPEVEWKQKLLEVLAKLEASRARPVSSPG